MKQVVWWFGRRRKTAGCRETCYSTAWQPLNSALMWGRSFTISAETMPETLPVTAPPVTKVLKGCGARSSYVPVPSGALGAGSSTCAHLQAGPAYLFPFPTAITGQGTIAGPPASPDLSLACASFPRDSTMSCTSRFLFHSIPFIPGRPGTGRKAVFRDSPVTDALSKLQTCPQSPLQQSLDHSFRGRSRHSSRGSAVAVHPRALALPRREIQAVTNP